MSELSSVNTQLEIVRQNLPELMEEKMSLPQILALMTQVDEGMVGASADEMIALMERAELKVDSYKYIIDKFESESERLARKIKEFQAAKAAIDNKVGRIESLLTFSMQKNNFSKFNGDEYKVRLNMSKSVATKRDPTAIDIVVSPDLVCVKYEWVKPELKKLLDKGDSSVLAIAEIKEKFTPIFSVNKGAADE